MKRFMAFLDDSTDKEKLGNFNKSFGFCLWPCFERSLKDAYWCFSFIIAIVDNRIYIFRSQHCTQILLVFRS